MCAKSVDDRSRIVEALRRAGRIVLTTHIRPDGDALGSMLALCLSARRAGKACRMVVPDRVPWRYAFLFDRHAGDPRERFAELAAEAELLVLLDTAVYAQLGELAETIRLNPSKLAIIDHHASAEVPAQAVWRDESAAAVAVMVAELLEELGWPLDPAGGEALMTGICADTGWFRYPNTDARALRVAADLVKLGVRPDLLYARLHQSDRPARVKLLAAALRSLELHAGERIAVMTLTQRDFSRTGAAPEETEDFASEPLRIASVAVAALLVEQDEGVVRGSLRSRESADVARIAARFGGGGHARASGFRTHGDIPSLRHRLIAACAEALGESAP